MVDERIALFKKDHGDFFFFVGIFEKWESGSFMLMILSNEMGIMFIKDAVFQIDLEFGFSTNMITFRERLIFADFEKKVNKSSKINDFIWTSSGINQSNIFFSNLLIE